ncbi:MAG: hypothetical protein GX601_18185 [Anaerolineales bacterium]|nr:hypothetical protein [Anaerolineales bacterium]
MGCYRITLLSELGERSEDAQAVQAAGYPVTLLFPADTRVAVVRGQWRRLDSGEIEATYRTRDELLMALGSIGIEAPAPAGRDEEGTWSI